MGDIPVSLLVLIPVAYMLGSVPFGLIVGLAKGIDPRTQGSRNIGATNVGRLLGGKYFALVFTLDLLKGLIPMAVATVILWNQPKTEKICLVWLLAGFGAIFGHMFSLFLKFKGGKGVATSAGVLLGLFPYYTVPGVVAILVWGIFFAIWRYVSLASIFGSIAFPIAYAIIGKAMGWPVLGDQLPLLIFAALVAVMIVIKHKTNIQRLLAGTENKIGGKS